MSPNEKIQEKRQHIDNIDKQLLKLLNDRAALSLEIRELKKSESCALYDPQREEEVVQKLCDINNGPLYNENVKTLFMHIMKIFRSLPDAK